MSPLRGTIPGLYLAPSDFVPDWKPGESYGPRALIDAMQQSNGMDHRIPECGSALSIVNSHCAVEDRSLLATRFDYVLGRSTIRYEAGNSTMVTGDTRFDESLFRRMGHSKAEMRTNRSKFKSIDSTCCKFLFHRYPDTRN